MHSHPRQNTQGIRRSARVCCIFPLLEVGKLELRARPLRDVLHVRWRARCGKRRSHRDGGESCSLTGTCIRFTAVQQRVYEDNQVVHQVQ